MKRTGLISEGRLFGSLQLSRSEFEAGIRTYEGNACRRYPQEHLAAHVSPGFRGEAGIAELCGCDGVCSSKHRRWFGKSLRAGEKRLAGDRARDETNPPISTHATGLRLPDNVQVGWRGTDPSWCSCSWLDRAAVRSSGVVCIPVIVSLSGSSQTASTICSILRWTFAVLRSVDERAFRAPRVSRVYWR